MARSGKQSRVLAACYANSFGRIPTIRRLGLTGLLWGCRSFDGLCVMMMGPPDHLHSSGKDCKSEPAQQTPDLTLKVQ